MRFWTPLSILPDTWMANRDSSLNVNPDSIECRAQTSPIVALIALFAVCVGVSLYATTLTDIFQSSSDRELAGPTADRIIDIHAPGGVLDPTNVTVAPTSASMSVPRGYQANISIYTDSDEWQYGPHPPVDNTHTDSVTRSVGVAVDSGVDWGIIIVRVWQ
ncbi:DUF7285 family protein [Haloquadratum walsbyi]|uniref:DUF7285 family protein n=1 Tax=Haloquadratum walsbyi TaxID=293091 RepID=UPI0015F58FFF|nr:hypothetical protein [Haloquadratum walsbyi]